MPTYVYETLEEDPEDRIRFELLQRISDPPHTTHPSLGLAIRRVIVAPAVAGQHGASRERALLSDRNVAEKGFTRYEKAGEGVWERTAGSDGPNRIVRDDSGSS
jgi:hypothetical protein